MKNIGLIVFFILLSTFSFAESCDTVRIKKNYEASKAMLSKNIIEAHRYAQLALNEANNCKSTRSYYESLIALSAVFYQQDNGDSIINLLLPIVAVLPQDCPVFYKAAFYHRLSSAYVMTLRFKEGLEHSFKALKLYEQINNEQNIINVLVNIANFYQQQNNFKQADKYLREAESKAKAKSFETQLANVYNTMGILYAENNYLDSAEKFFLISTSIREKLNDVTVLPWNYNNLGGLYVMLNKVDKAIEYLTKALKSFEENKNYDGQTSVTNNLGELYLEQNNFPKALMYFNYSRKLYKYTNNPDNLENLYHNLYSYYKKTGNTTYALAYADTLFAFKDSIYGNRLDQSIAEMQTKFDVEKKDLEIVNSKAKIELKEKQNSIKNIIIISGIGVFILVIIFIMQFYKRKKIESKLKLETEIAKLNELRSKAVIEAEEKERIRIAKDLHDGVGQLLSAAKLNLSSLQDKLQLKDDENLLLLSNATNLIDDSVKEVRSVSHSMMPNALLKLGLASAVKEFINKLSVGNKLKIDLDIVGLENRLEPATETVLFRVLQEIVSNIIKHAKANYINIQLIKHDKELTMLIEDNGVGFDTSKINSFEGIGLKNILSRVEFLNGNVDFDSTLSKGTTVVIEVPL